MFPFVLSFVPHLVNEFSRPDLCLDLRHDAPNILFDGLHGLRGIDNVPRHLITATAAAAANERFVSLLQIRKPLTYANLHVTRFVAFSTVSVDDNTNIRMGEGYIYLYK